MAITWVERMANLRNALGRRPTLQEALEVAQIHEMTPGEVDAQRRSWVRGMTTPCEHGELDFEQCGACRAGRDVEQSTPVAKEG
jgi:hypothetical protein